ncbi:MAG: hypothetical protein V7642_957 [Burkholderiales bacterium]
MARITLNRRLAVAIRKLRFLRGNVRLILIWPLVCILLVCLLWALTFSKLHTGRALLQENTSRQASSLSKAYAGRLSLSIAQIDHITLTLKHYWKETRGAIRLEEQRDQGLYPLSSRLYVTIVDRGGKPLTSTLPIRKDTPRITDRDYFQAHKADPGLGLVIGTPLDGLRLGKPVLIFSRSLEAADGSFDGLVIVATEPAYLASFIEDAPFGPTDFVSLRRDDGVILAVETGKPAASPVDVFRSSAVFANDKGVASMAGEKFTDGQSRIVAWQKLSGYPLISVVGLSDQEVAESYQVMVRNYRDMATAATVFLFLAAMTGMIVSSWLAWRKHQADQVKNAYRLATDGAREGFYMVRAMYDEQDNIVDFLVEDCNERGAAYYGLTRTEVIGVRFSKAAFGDHLQNV